MNTGVFAIEYLGDDGFDKDRTVVPLLDSVQHYSGGSFECLRVSSVEGLYNAIELWLSDPLYRSFSVLYLNFHGAVGSVCLGQEDVGIEELALFIRGRASGRFIHFGACESLGVSKFRLKGFLEISGAYGVSGYKDPISWQESVPLEFQLLGSLVVEGVLSACRRNGGHTLLNGTLMVFFKESRPDRLEKKLRKLKVEP